MASDLFKAFLLKKFVEIVYAGYEGDIIVSKICSPDSRVWNH